jgi:hypothetical protein
MAETGHARNVERFAQLISFVQGYGADYAPGNPAITLVNLQAKMGESEAGIDGVSSTRAPLTVAVNDRQNLFAELRPKTTRVVNGFAASGQPQNAVDDLKGLKRKIEGVKLKTLPKVTTGTPGEDDSDGKGHSASQQSYTQLTEHFDNLIELLETSGYAPNESELKLPALKAYATSLKNANTAVINATTPVSNARITRDQAMYADGTGLVDLAGLVKKYVKSVYGAESAQYDQIKGLEFKRPR